MPSRFGRPKLTLRRAAGRVDLELVAQPAEDPEHLAAGRRHRPDRHEERVDDDVLARDAVVSGPLDDPLRDGEPDVGVLADPGLVVADRDDRAPYFFTSGRTRSSRSSSPVTLLTSALPW